MNRGGQNNNSGGGIEVETLGNPNELYVDEDDPEDPSYIPEGEVEFKNGKYRFVNEKVKSRKTAPPPPTPPPPPPPSREEEYKYATFFPRGAWQADPAKCPDSIPVMEPPVTHFVITWTDTDECTTESECQLRMREIQQVHMKFRNFPDIRYHYVVGGDGSLYEGRGSRKAGERYPPSVGPVAETLNTNYVEVALIGQMAKQPTKKQIDVLSAVITLGQEENWLVTAFSVYWSTGSEVRFYKIYDASDEMPFMIGGNTRILTRPHRPLMK